MNVEYKCTECHAVFDESDARIRTEFDRSEFWGAVQVHRIDYVCCPDCGGDEVDELEKI